MSKKLHLVEGTVRETVYHGGSTEFSDTRIVLASDLDAADRVFAEYWEKQSRSFAVDYFVVGSVTTEIIEGD